MILGAGALGSIIAAHLARAGEDVTLLARGERAALLQKNGVAVRGIVDFTSAVNIVTNPAEMTDADLLVNTVKTYDTEVALEPLRHARIDSAISVQNGVQKNEQLAAAFGDKAALGCTADFSGEVLPDGSALFTRNIGIYIGELPGGVSPRVEAIVAALEGAGVRAAASDKIQTIEWSKFVAWLGLTSIAVLSRQVTHRMLQDPDLGRLNVTLVREAALVARALGIPIEDMGGALMAHSVSTLPLEEALEMVRTNGAAMESAGVTSHKMSALQDAERGRRLEVEETLGYAVRKGAEFGIDTPAVETCYRLLSGINRGFAADRG